MANRQRRYLFKNFERQAVECVVSRGVRNVPMVLELGLDEKLLPGWTRQFAELGRGLRCQQRRGRA